MLECNYKELMFGGTKAMTKFLYVISMVFILFCCANPKYVSLMQEQSAGQIPCYAGNIEIIEHNLNKEDSSGSWMALCSGRTYLCKRSADSGEGDPSVTCEESIAQMPE